MPTVTYEYRGQSYNSEEEAQQAKQKYNDDKKLRYLDAASVGFDKNRYDQLIANGQGISQMSDDERKYIMDSFANSDQTSVKYTKSDADKLLYDLGMPPMKELSKYRIGYAKYTADGDFEQNYGHISDDQWKKINELWAKDWEYGLTDQDYLRKAAGLAPVAYDSMYEDTLLDQELKAKGLPPSKLLNGKLGATYNEWAKNDATHSEIMNEIARRYVSVKSNSLFNGYNSEDKPFDDEERAQYDSMLMSDAILSVQNDPKYAEFFGKHYGAYGSLPETPGNDYIKYEKDPITGDKY
ncbi:MAG: hypothetical protein IIT64_11285, partial [Bacteroidaceae bacterium]|nr:hypothetical protein [Bacteroidaceae bacterium]